MRVQLPKSLLQKLANAAVLQRHGEISLKKTAKRWLPDDMLTKLSQKLVKSQKARRP